MFAEKTQLNPQLHRLCESDAAAPVGTTLSEVQEAVATGEAGDALAVSTAVGLKVRGESFGWSLKMVGK